jgi:prophage maintenance system killer protein
MALRTGANAAITFLLINDWDLDFNEDQLVDLVLSVASGMTSKSAVTEIFEGSCRHASNPLTG